MPNGPYDPGSAFGDDPYQSPGLAPSAAVGASPGGSGPNDPGSAFGDNPYQIPSVQPSSALPVLANIAIPVTYVPIPATAALMITEAGMDEGAYPCAVTENPDGSFELTASLTAIPAGLTPGKVSVQVGNLVDGVFTAATINGIAVPPDTGTLSLSGAGAILPDLTITLGAPQADVTDASPLQAGSGGYVHVPVSAVNEADGSSVDLRTWAVLLAITRGNPAPSDFQAGDWLVVTAPLSVAGLYARLAASTALLTGNYRVYVQLLAPQAAGTLTRRCPGYLAVQG